MTFYLDQHLTKSFSYRSLGGLLVYAAMKITNETQEQRHHWQVQRELEHNK